MITDASIHRIYENDQSNEHVRGIKDLERIANLECTLRLCSLRCCLQDDKWLMILAEM